MGLKWSFLMLFIIHSNLLVTFKNCLFVGVKLAKNDDPDKYVYTGLYWINSGSEF